MNSLLPLDMPMIYDPSSSWFPKVSLTSQLQDACTKWQIKIKIGKCKLDPLQQHITIEGNDIEN